jgi:GcrA cell cycle regulator
MEWTEERIEALTRMWREGLSASQVARQLGGVSRSAVIGKVHRLGIAGRETPSRPHALGGRPATRVRASSGGVRRAAAPARSPTSASTAALTQAPAPRTVFEVAPTASIHTLSEHGCRWPIGEPDQEGFGFCGRIRIGAGSYCAGHAPMATRRRDGALKAKDIERLVSRYVENATQEPGAAPRWREIA